MRRFLSVTFAFSLVFSSLLLLAVSCKPSAQKDKGNKDSTVAVSTPVNFEKVLPGVWIGCWLHVEVTGAGGTPLDRVVDVKEDSWKETFHRTPLRTEYFPNHTLRWEYYENDSFAQSPMIAWRVYGTDSIEHIDTSFTDNNFKYRMIYHSDSLIEFRTIVDWDFDGTKDDLYYGKIRRARKGE